MALPIAVAAGAAIKAIFKNWELYAGIVVVVALGLASYSTYNWIYDRGHQAGIDATVAKYKPQIDRFNAEALVRNAKIADLEKAFAQQVASLISLNDRIQGLSNTSLVTFTENFPEVSQECGIQQPTASAYNDFLQKALISK